MAQRSEKSAPATTPTEVVAARLAKLRKDRGWSAAYVAELMHGQGIPWRREIVANLERGRRGTISVDELLAMALIFDVPLPWLLIDSDHDETPVTPQRTERSADVLRWLAADRPLPDMRDDPRRQGEWQLPAEIVSRVRLFDRDANTLYAASLSEEVTAQLASRVRKRADHVRQAGFDPVVPDDLVEIADEVGVDLRGGGDGSH